MQGFELLGVEEDCVYNSNPPGPTEFEAAVEVHWSENVTIRRLTIRRHSGDGVFIGWGAGPDGWADGQIPPGGKPVVVPKSRNIAILDNDISCVARQGMALAWTEGIRVEGNRLDLVGQSGIDLEHFGLRNVTIVRNHFGRVQDQLFISSVPVDNLEFSHNVSNEPIYMAVRDPGITNGVFEYNVGRKVNGNDGTVFADAFLRIGKGGPYRIVGNQQLFSPHYQALIILPPQLIQVPGTSLRTRTGVCHLYVEGNNFSGAGKFWTNPVEFPPGCGWVDGGGNRA